MTPNLHYAARYITRSRGGNIPRLISLTLGLSIGIVIFAYAYYMLSFDRGWRDRERIYQVWSQNDYGFTSMQVTPLANALREEIPQVESATRTTSFIASIDLVWNEDVFPTRVLRADSCLFDVLDFGIVQGDPAAVLNDPSQLLLSEECARRIFGDEDPVGKFLRRPNSEFAYSVGGVFRTPPYNTHIGRFDVLTGFPPQYRMDDWQSGDSFPTYVKLRPGVSPDEAEAQLARILAAHPDYKQMQEDYHFRNVLRPIDESTTTGSGLRALMTTLMALALLTLFVATMNYVLISVSTLISRSKTVAMLKMGGARPHDIFVIFLSETLLLVGLSTLAATLLIFALQPLVESMTPVHFTVGDIFAVTRIWVPAAVIAGCFLLASAIPGSIFMRIPVSLAFRGKAATHRRWKQALLFLQILSTTLAVAFLTVVVLQYRHIAHNDIGFSHERVYHTRQLGSRSTMRNYVERLRSMPEVEGACLAFDLPDGGYSGQPAIDEATGEILFRARCTYVDCDFFATMHIPMVAGRDFRPGDPENYVVVNECYCEHAGIAPEEIVGRRIFDGEAMTVAGVARDFRTDVASGSVQPIVLHQLLPLFTEGRQGSCYTLVRLRETTPEAVARLEEAVRSMPTASNWRIISYEQTRAATLSEERTFMQAVLLMSAVILALVLTGIVGYLNDEVHRRAREIALRKVHGSTAEQIQRLMAHGISLVALPAIVGGVALAVWAARKWLAEYTSTIALSWWIFAAAAVAVSGVILLTQFLCVHRTAHANPIDEIKRNV